MDMDKGILITETIHGLICANSGIDSSNVEGSEYVTLLPDNPDLSAKKLYYGISSFFPKDGEETQKMVNQAYEKIGPTFISLKNDPTLSSSITAAK